jgi:hypothetical protein
MHPVRLTIPGKYWDSRLYSGRLYLFGTEGSLRVLDWELLRESLRLAEPLQLPYTAAFVNSSILYSPDNRVLVKDAEIRHTIEQRFRALSDAQLEATSRQIESATLSQQTSPFPFPHADCEIYNNHIYVASKSGIDRAKCRRRAKAAKIKSVERLLDIPSFAISASYGCLAAAAGSEGLYQIELFDVPKLDGDEFDSVQQLSPTHCSSCSWNYWSIFGSSHIADGCLATFTKKQQFSFGERNRQLGRLIPAQEIFQHRGYSWGVQDKICQARPGAIDVYRYSPWFEEETERLEHLGSISFAVCKSKIVSAAVAAFGVVVECEDALVVVPSAGVPVTLPKEPINWHVFPRSTFYENQLHVIYEDRLEVLSFNHDYFVDQKQKIAGFRVFGGPKLRR